MKFLNIKIHHRDYAYRPPYVEKKEQGQFSLLFRFMRTYLLRHKWGFLLCSIMAALDFCGSFFLMAYYSRVVVDSILVVQPAAPAAASVLAPGRDFGNRPWAEERTPRPSPLPTEGIGRRIDLVLRGALRPADAGRRLGLMALLYMGTIVASSLINRLGSRLEINIGQKLTARLREDLHAKIMRLSYGYHTTQTPGRLMARILSDIGTLQEQLKQVVINSVSEVIMIAAGFAFLFVIEWRMGLLVFLMTPLYVAVYRVIHPWLHSFNTEMRHTNTCLYGLVSQKMDAIKVIQAYGQEGRERLAFQRLAACYFRDSFLLNRWAAAAGYAAELISILGTNGAVFLFGIHQVLAGSMTLGQMLYAFGIAASLFAPVMQLSFLNVSLTGLLVSVRRVMEVLDEPVKIQDAPDAVEMPAPLARGIALRRVRFGYRPDSEPVLREIALDIPAGQWLCVMGASGAGKTTLLYLIARIFEPDAGEILFDDVPLARIKMASLHRRVALVPQEAQILSGTVRDNICYGHPDASPGEIMAAARAADFHEFVMTLPVQYETILGEKGTSLSGGQKQRLSLARALVTSPEVLLLDDCTSSLDAETEHRIQETLARILKGKTAVIVTQRVSMAQRCHRVCVLENGLVSELGAPSELLARGGFYARIHAQQTA